VGTKKKVFSHKSWIIFSYASAMLKILNHARIIILRMLKVI
jgi:hypothetical protein